MSVPSYPHLLTGWTFVRVSSCLWRAAEYATPKYNCRSWGHATAKCAALAYYLELWALENQQMQGEVCSELPYLPIGTQLPSIPFLEFDQPDRMDSCHRKGEEKSIPCLDSLSHRQSHLPSIFLRTINSFQFSRSVVSESLQPHEPQHARPPCPSPTPGVHPNPCPLSWWCHPTVSSSIVPSPPALNLSQHQGLFRWVRSSHQVAKVLEFQLQHQSFQWTPRTAISLS